MKSTSRPTVVRALIALVGVAAVATSAWANAACAVDIARFVDRGPGFTDQRSGALWRYCAAPQSIDVKTKRCSGAIFATEKWSAAKAYVDRLNEQLAARVQRQGAAAAASAPTPPALFRLPTIDEVSELAEAHCEGKAFGRTPLADYGGAPIWTVSSAPDGKVWQFDPDDGGRKAVNPDDAPAVILLLFNLPRR